MRHFLVTIWSEWDYWVVSFDSYYSEESFKKELQSWMLKLNYSSDDYDFKREAKEIEVSQDRINWFNKAAALIEDKETSNHKTVRVYSIN